MFLFKKSDKIMREICKEEADFHLGVFYHFKEAYYYNYCSYTGRLFEKCRSLFYCLCLVVMIFTFFCDNLEIIIPVVFLMLLALVYMVYVLVFFVFIGVVFRVLFFKFKMLFSYFVRLFCK